MKKKLLTPLVLVIAMTTVVALIICIALNGSRIPISRDESIPLANGWECCWEGSRETIPLSLPGTVSGGYAGRILHLSNTLPIRFFHNSSLMIRTSEQSVRVHLNDIPLYEFVPHDLRRAPGSMYHFINVPADYEGGRLDIFLSSPLNQFSGVVNEVRVGTITSHILFILNQGSIGLILAVVSVILGLIMLCFFLAMLFSGSKHLSILYFALFVILSGFWMCTESRALELFVRNPQLIMCISFMAQYLAPIPLLAFVVNTYKPRHGHWLIKFLWIFAVCFAVSTVLYLFNSIEFYDTAVLFHILLAFSIVALCLTAIREIRHGNKSIKLFFMGCILLSMTICADILRYYFLSLPWVVKPVLYQFGLILFIITTTASLAQQIFITREEKISHDILMSLAFTDNLTGLKNRRSFDERIATINADLDSYSSIHLIILDINGLKGVNDTYGHKEGDRLIVEGARLINETLGRLGELFRMGGDEFIVLVTNIESYFLQVELETLNKMIADFNKSASPFQISIAYGLDSYDKGQDKDLYSVFVRADKSMYICKENQKGMKPDRHG